MNADGSYGVGGQSIEGTYADGYDKPWTGIYTQYEKAVYENGVIVGGVKGGYVWGESLLIIGDKSSVSIKSTDESYSTEKTVHDLDAGERTAHFLIQPSLAVFGSQGSDRGVIDDVVLEVDLPKGLSYSRGNASREPDEIIENDDGTTVLKWNFPDTTAGKTMPAIQLACMIGAAGTPEDVKNNEELVATAKTFSGYDQRECTAANGNLAQDSISVIRLATVSVAKTVDRSLMELGDGNTWHLFLGNSSNEDVFDMRMYDVLPYDGDSRGSDYSGEYRISSITIDFVDAPRTKTELDATADGYSALLKATQDASIRDDKATDVLKESQDGAVSWNGAPGGSAEWSDIAPSEQDGTCVRYSFDADGSIAGISPTAFLVAVDTLKSNEYISVAVEWECAAEDGSLIAGADGNVQKAGDRYVNNFSEYADRQAAVVTSNSVAAEVVSRSVSGCIWDDDDGDGIRKEGEETHAGVEASLYSEEPCYAGQQPTSVKVNGKTAQVYKACDVYGNEVNSVVVGADGSYRFDELPSGRYLVAFEGGEMDSKATAPVGVGGDDSKDSDAMPSIEDGVLASAVISGIVLPSANDMIEWEYESADNDLGLVPYSRSIVVEKDELADDMAITALPGAGLAVKDIASGKYLVFDVAGKATGALAGEATADNGAVRTTGSDGRITVSGLGLGDYEICEIIVPDGYIPADPIRFSIVQAAVQRADGNVEWNAEVRIAGDDGGTTVSTADAANPVRMYDESAITSITFNKTWDDDNDRDGLRRDAVFTVVGTVAGTGEVVYTGKATVKAADGVAGNNNATVRLENLLAYADGKPVVYSVSEADAAGYEKSVGAVSGDWESGYSVSATNTHQPAMAEYKVRKNWNDDDDRDGIRPVSATFTLYGSDGSERTATVSADAWSASFGKVSVYHDGGKKIEYKIKETPIPDGYVASNAIRSTIVEGTASGDGAVYEFAVENVHEIEKREITAVKTWDDDSDRDGLRPTSLEFTLTGSDGSTRTAVANASSGWEAVFSDLPVYHNHGTRIDYRIHEKDIPAGYTASANANGGVPDERGDVVVVNAHEPARVDIPVKKIWDDDGDRDGLRSDKIKLSLNGTDGSVREATLSADSGWEYTFAGLPVCFNHGKKIVYTLVEEPIDGYTHGIVKGADGYSFTITNTHEIAKTAVAVSKTWNDDDDRDGIRPDSIHVVLRGSDGSTREADFGEDAGWSGVFEDLPVYHSGGQTIAYTVEEAPIEGYSAEIVKNDVHGYSWSITNSHSPLLRDIAVEKSWNDDDDRDGMRPDSITVILSGDDGSARESVVSPDDDGKWRCSFTGLPVYRDNGTPIDYTVSEAPIAGYEMISAVYVPGDGENQSGARFLIENEHVPTTLDVVVEKQWRGDDEDDRPDTLPVIISGSDGSERELVLEPDDGASDTENGDVWHGTLEKIPARAGGADIEYSVFEEDVPDGYSLSGISEESATVHQRVDGSSAIAYGFEIINEKNEEPVTDLAAEPIISEQIAPPPLDDSGVASEEILAKTGEARKWIPALLAAIVAGSFAAIFAARRRSKAQGSHGR